MIMISNVEELNKDLRTLLIQLSNVSGKNVRNAIELYGADLETAISTNDNELNGLSPSDSMILFSLHFRNSTSDITFTENSNIVYSKGFSFEVSIYGDNAETLANVIVANCLTESVIETMADKGIYFEHVSMPEESHEFINGRIWLRTDFEIDINCYINLDKLIPDYNIQTLSSMDTIQI